MVHSWARVSSQCEGVLAIIHDGPMAGWPESRTFDKHVVNSQARRFPRDGCKGTQSGFILRFLSIFILKYFCTLNTGTFNLEADVTTPNLVNRLR